MDRLWPAVTVLTLAIVSTAGGTPLDTAYDLLHAIEYCDGNALLETFSESLRLQIVTQIDQMRQIALKDPAIAGITVQRLGGGVTEYDLEHLTVEELLGKGLERISLSSSDMVEEEQVTMSGRTASVALYWPDGESISFRMVWENSSWKITGTDLLSILFR